MKKLIVLLSVLSVLSALGAETPIRRPLDLPSGGMRQTGQDDDEIPEIIQFYGHHYEADAFLFVIDRSGSMSTGNKWGTLLEEMVTAIQGLSSEAELGIVAFSTPIVPWNPQMVVSGPNARALAITFLSELQPMGATCISLGVNAGLQVLRSSSKEIDSRRLILIGDGGQFCSGNNDPEMVVAEIVTGNWDMHRIDTIFLGDYPSGIELFAAIAQENGGQMRIVQ
ncbi:MAG: VWA domain-containing protein [Planctomycetota bacterium]|nr:VWA domain-containing protein [Planctomycetota bacterium]